MQTGDPVEVKTRFQGSWSCGFTVAAVRGVDHSRFVLRRNSDGVVLPETFSDDDVRPATRRLDTLRWQ